MIKIAFITPWPPQHSGIADHIYYLVSSLKDSFSIDIITNAQNPKLLDGVKIYHYQEDIDYKSYDELIYEIGNNYNFHYYMIALIKRYGGVVHLHDFVLQQFIVQYIFESGGRWQGYIDTIEKWYGQSIGVLVNELKEIHNINFWETKEIGMLPLCEEILQYSTGCIVHSDYVLEKLKKIYPNKKILKTWLFPSLNEKFIEKNSTKEIFDIGIFGNIDINRNIEKSIRVIKELLDEFNIQLHIVGELNQNQKYLVTKYKNIDNIHFYGRVNSDKFDVLLDNIDICINLRYPTMGETSSIAIRCLQKGIALIVNDIGWYSELPDFVVKIQIEESIDILEKELIFLLDRDKLNLLKDNMNDFLVDELNSKRIRDEYINIINKLHLKSADRDIYKNISAILDDLSYQV